MDNKKTKIGLCDILQIIFSVIFFAGLLSFFKACGPKEDGSFMTCHWANMALSGLSALLLAVSALKLFFKENSAEIALDICTVLICILAALVPGKLIGLCMMASMRCRSVMRPAAIVMSVLIAVIALIDIITVKKK